MACRFSPSEGGGDSPGVVPGGCASKNKNFQNIIYKIVCTSQVNTKGDLEGSRGGIEFDRKWLHP